MHYVELQFKKKKNPTNHSAKTANCPNVCTVRKNIVQKYGIALCQYLSAGDTAMSIDVFLRGGGLRAGKPDSCLGH